MKWTLISILLLLAFSFYVSGKITGEATTQLTNLSILVDADAPLITILSPLNQTYFTQRIYFNVASNETLSICKLSLDDWTNAFIMSLNSSLTSANYTKPGMLNGNYTAKFLCKDTVGNINDSEKVLFQVIAEENYAPIIRGLNESIYVCEGSELSYIFNATDNEDDTLTPDISPKNPFYILTLGKINATATAFQIFSGTITKENIGINNGFSIKNEIVTVSDGEYADTKNINITLIEINNAPVLEDIGAQTVWTKGENSTLYRKIGVTDVEDGNQDSKNLSFSISFTGTTLFNISNQGVINFTANSSQIGVYNVSLCVEDKGLKNPFTNISQFCGQTGAKIKVCRNFSITITNNNRYPAFVNYYPTNLSIVKPSNENLYFNITKNDPDGTIPDSYWFVNGILKTHLVGNSIDEFSNSFGCGVSGNYTIKSTISDGLLNASLEWAVNISYVTCETPSKTSGGGGGSSSSVRCSERWVCSEWEVCQNLKKSFDSAIISPEDYANIKGHCDIKGFDERFCGFQIKTCQDLKNCNNKVAQNMKPDEIQVCYFTENPSCNDKITNCHDGKCEILADCGGPCSACPSCSDGIKNQGEQGIDCNGPCPNQCPKEPLSQKEVSTYIVLAVLALGVLVVIVLIVWQTLKIRKMEIRIKKAKVQGNKPSKIPKL